MRPTKFYLFQQLVLPGNPEKNTRNILKHIAIAKKQGCEVFVAPELAVPGYFIGDPLWETDSFLRRCELCNHLIIEASVGITVIFGSVTVDLEQVGEDGRTRKYNSLIVADHAGEGKFHRISIVHKTLMPNYREFDDSRYFYDNRKLAHVIGRETQDLINPIMINNRLKIGCMLCEDGWNDDYSINPASILAAKGADILVNISCSPYTHQKNIKRNKVFSKHACEGNVPMIYVNNVGIQNNNKNVYAFDGSSCVYDAINGLRLDIPCNTFEEYGWAVTIDNNSFGTSSRINDDIETEYRAIKYMLKNFMEQCGQERLVIGASGGMDSSLVAAIAADTIDPQNILLVNIPTKYNSKTTKDIARNLANNLGTKYKVHPIQDAVDMAEKSFELDGKVPTSFQMENMQARYRSADVLSMYAAMFNAVFTCNSNKSEMTIGYCTIGGDIMGFASPIADLYKDDGPYGVSVNKLARWYNENVKNAIPEEVFDIAPSAELSAEQTVGVGGDPLYYPYHDKLFASWVERWKRLSPVDILRYQIKGTLEHELMFEEKKIVGLDGVFPDNESFVNDLERWWKLYTGLAVAKRCLTPPTFTVSRRAFGFDQREAQMQTNLSDDPEYIFLKEHLFRNKC